MFFDQHEFDALDLTNLQKAVRLGKIDIVRTLLTQQNADEISLEDLAYLVKLQGVQRTIPVGIDEDFRPRTYHNSGPVVSNNAYQAMVELIKPFIKFKLPDNPNDLLITSHIKLPEPRLPNISDLSKALQIDEKLIATVTQLIGSIRITFDNNIATGQLKEISTTIDKISFKTKIMDPSSAAIFQVPPSIDVLTWDNENFILQLSHLNQAQNQKIQGPVIAELD